MPVDFLTESLDTNDDLAWAPFCPDRDKYWGIAARTPQESCDVIPEIDISAVVSDDWDVRSQDLPLDMPRTHLCTAKAVFLKPEISNKGRVTSTEGETGLIHLGDDPNEGWYYVTQPIPKIEDGKVVGYFSLIGRKATLLPEKQEKLQQFLETS